MAERHSPGPTPAAPSGAWVYGVVGAADPIRFDGLTGVTGEPVRFVPADGLVAVVGSVELTGFADDGSVADLELLERIARAHHQVLTVPAGAGALVPFRLGTVHHHDERVAEVVAQHHAELVAALRLADRRTEWGVKVQVGLARFEATLPDPADTAARTGGAGTAYLLRRRVEREATERLRQAIDEHADDTHRTLDAFAAVSRRFPGRGMALELTGPRPPSSVSCVNGWEPQGQWVYIGSKVTDVYVKQAEAGGRDARHQGRGESLPSDLQPAQQPADRP